MRLVGVPGLQRELGDVCARVVARPSAAINAAVPGANITFPDGRNPDGPPDNFLDTTRLRADTGLRPEYDVERAVPDYADWPRRQER